MNMKKYLVFAAALILAVSCGRKEDESLIGEYSPSQEYAFSGFNKIKTISSGNCGAFDIMLVKAKEYGVSMELPVLNPGKGFEIRQKGNTLVLKATKLSKKIREYGPAKVVIATPAADGISLDGANKLRVDGEFSARKMVFDLSGASELGYIQGSCQELDIELSGASRLTAVNINSGGCDLKASGASDASYCTLTGPELDIELSGASKAIGLETSAKALKVSLSGSSALGVNNGKEMDRVQAMVSGSSSFAIAGPSCKEMSITSSGSSTADITELPVESAKVDASGAAAVKVNAGSLASETSGAADVQNAAGAR